MSNPSGPGPEDPWAQPASYDPVPTGPDPTPYPGGPGQPSPYAPNGLDAGPAGPTPPPPASRKSGTWRIVVGLLIALSSGVYVIRGLAQLVLSFVRPEMVPGGPAFAFGYVLPPIVLLALGVFLVRRGLTLNRSRREPGSALR